MVGKRSNNFDTVRLIAALTEPHRAPVDLRALTFFA